MRDDHKYARVCIIPTPAFKINERSHYIHNINYTTIDSNMADAAKEKADKLAAAKKRVRSIQFPNDVGKYMLIYVFYSTG